MSMKPIAVKRGKKGELVEIPLDGNGEAFVVTFSHLKRILRHNNDLRDNEEITRIEINERGFKVFVEPLNIK